MATAVAPYDEWLSNKLLSLGEDVDAEVFVTYIIGLLDTDSSSDEKRESLQELLGQIMVCGGLSVAVSVSRSCEWMAESRVHLITHFCIFARSQQK